MAKSSTTSAGGLDEILGKIGDFGRYQRWVFGLVCLAIISHSSVHIAYVFTAMDLDYRCEIPGCDVKDKAELDYKPEWLANAVPFSKLKPSKCERFETYPNDSVNCSKRNDFNRQRTEICSSFVYRTKEHTLVQQFDIHCDEKLWMLTLVGTTNNIAQFFGSLTAGILSDKFGRKYILIFGLVLCGICGLLRTLSPTYVWFLVFEFLDAMFAAGSYVCGFILGVELVGPKKRVLAAVVASSCYAFGEVFVAGSAWLVQSWKSLIYVLYTPPLFLLLYIWLIPESVRWYISKNRIEEAKTILKKAAKVNGKELPDTLFDTLDLRDQENTGNNTIFDIFKSRTLTFRLINCSFCWVTCAFLFFGLTLNSVALAGNHYLDFILTSLVEIPAYVLCVYIVDRFGRKASLSGSFILTGVACAVFIFAPKASHYVSLVIYLIGKFGATAAFTVIYLVTSELFPTTLRHTIMGSCFTFARFGSMISPQTPLLMQIWEPFPLVMFASMSLVAGLLSLLFPETLNLTLPDSLEEAEGIGKKPARNYETC